MFLRQAAKQIFYHGTASGNDTLRTILKQGLVPDPKERRYTPPKGDFDPSDVMQVRDLEYVTYGGSYLASDLVTALHYALGAQKDLGGDLVIVAAQVETRSPEVTIDEDQFLSTVNIRLALMSLRDLLSELAGNDWPSHADLYRAVVSGRLDVKKLVSPFLDILLDKRPLAISKEKLLRYEDELTELLVLSFEFEAATGSQTNRTKMRSPAEIAADFREKANALFKRISGLGDPIPGRNVRSFDPITYRGANRILAILTIKPDASAGQVVYSSDDRLAARIASEIESILDRRIKWNVETEKPFLDYATGWTNRLLNEVRDRTEFIEPDFEDLYNSSDIDDERADAIRETIESNWGELVDEHTDDVIENVRVETNRKMLDIYRRVESCGGEEAVDFLDENFDDLITMGYLEDEEDCIPVHEIEMLSSSIVQEISDKVVEKAVEQYV